MGVRACKNRGSRTPSTTNKLRVAVVRARSGSCSTQNKWTESTTSGSGTCFSHAFRIISHREPRVRQSKRAVMQRCLVHYAHLRGGALHRWLTASKYGVSSDHTLAGAILNRRLRRKRSRYSWLTQVRNSRFDKLRGRDLRERTRHVAARLYLRSREHTRQVAARFYIRVELRLGLHNLAAWRVTQ